MFDGQNWKVFELNDEESLVDMKNTNSFEKIEFVACPLPTLEKL